jgi:alcohol dehydrogenase class IV
MALANAGLGAVHGIAGPAGGMRAAPHGMLCAALLPHVMAANLIALRAAASSPPALERFAEVARLVTGRSGVTPEDGVAWLRNFVRELGIPGLRTMGFSKDELPALADKSLAASSMKANPVSLSRAQVIGILEQAW